MVCRELGFEDGQAQCCSTFGELPQYGHVVTHKVLLAREEKISHVMRKTAFCISENKGTDQQAVIQLCCNCAVTVQLNSALAFATKIVQSLFLINWKIQASSHLLLLYSPVCV